MAMDEWTKQQPTLTTWSFPERSSPSTKKCSLENLLTFGYAKIPMAMEWRIPKSAFTKISASGTPVTWNTKSMACSGPWITGFTIPKAHPSSDIGIRRWKREDQSFPDSGGKRRMTGGKASQPKIVNRVWRRSFRGSISVIFRFRTSIEICSNG